MEKIKQQAHYWKKEALSKRKELMNKRKADEAADYKYHAKRQRSKHLNTRLSMAGGYRLATQRNCAHAGCETVMNILGLGFSRFAMNRWETLLACNLLHLHRSWMLANYKCIGRRPDQSQTLASQDLHAC